MWVEFDGDKDDEKSALGAQKKAVVQQLQLMDPTTGQPYVHDMWIELPTFWIRMHYVQRDRQFSPKDQELAGLGDDRFTMIVGSETQEVLVDTSDTWRFSGDFLLRPFVGATFFSKDLEVQEIQLEGQFDFAARKLKGLPVPTGPTENEILEHNLTHLPFRSWCPVCVQSKLKTKPQQTNFHQTATYPNGLFMKDKDSSEVTLMNALDVLSGLGLPL